MIGCCYQHGTTRSAEDAVSQDQDGGH